MNQNVELSVWLGLVVLALVSAQILLRRTSRALDKSRQNAPVHAVRHLPSSLAPAAIPEPAVSVVAS